MAVDVYSFACPMCGARMGQWCQGRAKDDPHSARQAKVPKRAKPGSVNAIPTAFETNRRRH